MGIALEFVTKVVACSPLHDLRRWGSASAGQRYLNGKTGGDPRIAERCGGPDFFQLGNKHVLFHSTERKVIWMTGDYDAKEQRLRQQQRGELDYGPHVTMRQSMVDTDGNRILWGWIGDAAPDRYSRAGWAGSMSHVCSV